MMKISKQEVIDLVNNKHVTDVEFGMRSDLFDYVRLNKEIMLSELRIKGLAAINKKSWRCESLFDDNDVVIYGDYKHEKLLPANVEFSILLRFDDFDYNYIKWLEEKRK